MDLGDLVVLVGGIGFIALAILAIRKMATRGADASLGPGEPTREATAETLPSPVDAATGPHAGLPSAQVGPLSTLVGARPAAEPLPVGRGEAVPAQSLVSREPTSEAAEPSRTSMARGLEKTRKGFMAQIGRLLFKELDASLVDELEALMISSDLGVRTTSRLLADLRERLSRREVQDPRIVREHLRSRIAEIVARPAPALDFSQGPTVMMVLGVNGVGKTTTIGKLAARLVREGKTVVLAAGDTFRAAAVEQLEVWGQRSGAIVVKGPDGRDPSSVIFDAIQRARSIGAHACICDTAGRLHTKVNLMEELKKLRRVMAKALDGAPHEVLMVLDATTGQNAIAQARQFKEAVEVNSIALTKLDGTAKGGVVVAICDELELPVRYVGVGEKVEDLQDFDPKAFVDALFMEEGS